MKQCTHEDVSDVVIQQETKVFYRCVDCGTELPQDYLLPPYDPSEEDCQ